MSLPGENVDPFGWREQGAEITRRNHVEFRRLLGQAQRSLEGGDLHSAAAYAEVAACHAVASPCGLFASAELEAILRRIGGIGVGSGSAAWRGTVAHGRTRILHVATTVQQIGGLTQMIWRWIGQDSGRYHSVVLIRQRSAVPVRLAAAVQASGGRLTLLNDRPGGLLTRARRLREVAADADLVVLHVGNRDVVPVLAFADRVNRPPVIYLDHADHLFWIGASIADLVISLRPSGQRLAQQRRGIAAERSCLVPILIEPVIRTMDRAAAKRALGLDPEVLVLVSVARRLKYGTAGAITYADAHVPFLASHPQAVLLVVGAGRRDDWRPAAEATGGRIMTYEERPDTAIFYEAADIYVDAFPFVSTSSILEAAIRGVPVVSRFPYSGSSAILGVDMPGLEGLIIRPRSLGAYTAALTRLAANSTFRDRLGALTRASVLATHTGRGWQDLLELAYAQASSLPPGVAPACPPDGASFGEPDVFLPFTYGNASDPDGLLAAEVGLFPWARRIGIWSALAARRGLGAARVRNVIRAVVPDCVVVCLRHKRGPRGVRHLASAP